MFGSHCYPSTTEGRVSCVVRRRARAAFFARDSDEKIVIIFRCGECGRTAREALNNSLHKLGRVI